MARAVTTSTHTESEGDFSLTEEAVNGWSAGQKKCRARRRHNWGPHTVREHRTFLDVVERCRDCRNLRHADFVRVKTRRGEGLLKVTDWKPDYRDNYLLPKGAARLDEEIMSELVADEILSRKIVLVPDDESDYEYDKQGERKRLVGV